MLEGEAPDLNALKRHILSWARKRSILSGSRPLNQFSKTVEEMGELNVGLQQEDPDLIEDGIGDVVVTLVILADLCNLDFNQCVQSAYDEIKHRKGRLVDGVFVKESDLKARGLPLVDPDADFEEDLGPRQTDAESDTCESCQ